MSGLSDFYYLFYSLFVFGITLAVSILYKVGVHKRLKDYARAWLLVSLPFIIWDALVADKHWFFADKYTTGIRLIGLPIEEILFFFSVPFACTVVWYLVKKDVKGEDKKLKYLLIVPLFYSLGLLFWSKGGYTTIVAVLGLIFGLFLNQRQLPAQKAFWVFQLIVLLLFITNNWFLSGLPIVTYNEATIIGERFLSIPLEDFIYNFVLINGFIYFFSSKDR